MKLEWIEVKRLLPQQKLGLVIVVDVVVLLLLWLMMLFF